jgi:hypothetical protein
MLTLNSLITKKAIYIYMHIQNQIEKMEAIDHFQGNCYKRNILRPTKVFQVIHNIPQAVYIHEFLKKLDPSPATEI